MAKGGCATWEDGMLTERTFDAGEVAIHYLESSATGPLLIMLHGIAATWQVFETTIPFLAVGWRVVAVDLRGHGQSGRVVGGYTLLEYARDVQALHRHLSDEPAVVVGSSLGAMVAIALASGDPDAVRAVVLEDPPLGFASGAPGGMLHEYPQFIAIRDLVAAGYSAPELVRILTPQMQGQDGVSIRRRAANLSNLDTDVLTMYIEDRCYVGFDLGERLGRVTCPALLLQGNMALGGTLTDSEARWAVSLMADCVHVSLPEAGHGIRGTLPDRYRSLVTGFLATV
jgi:pimeloyl-ACP methyl ester carboxylesterase